MSSTVQPHVLTSVITARSAVLLLTCSVSLKQRTIKRMNTVLTCLIRSRLRAPSVTSLLPALLVIQDLEEILNLKDRHGFIVAHGDVWPFPPDGGHGLVRPGQQETGRLVGGGDPQCSARPGRCFTLLRTQKLWFLQRFLNFLHP